jgi:phage repressor protein C with HTH and peptisase S24 domain
MEPTFYEDDIVVINLADKKPVDNGVFAVNYEGEAVVKRLSRDAGQWWLMSDNPDQRKYYRRICKGTECIIVGRIVRREGDHF